MLVVGCAEDSLLVLGVEDVAAACFRRPYRWCGDPVRVFRTWRVFEPALRAGAFGPWLPLASVGPIARVSGDPVGGEGVGLELGLGGVRRFV